MRITGNLEYTQVCYHFPGVARIGLKRKGLSTCSLRQDKALPFYHKPECQSYWEDNELTKSCLGLHAPSPMSGTSISLHVLLNQMCPITVFLASDHSLSILESHYWEQCAWWESPVPWGLNIFSAWVSTYLRVTLFQWFFFQYCKVISSFRLSFGSFFSLFSSLLCFSLSLPSSKSSSKYTGPTLWPASQHYCKASVI